MLCRKLCVSLTLRKSSTITETFLEALKNNNKTTQETIRVRACKCVRDYVCACAFVRVRVCFIVSLCMFTLSIVHLIFCFISIFFLVCCGFRNYLLKKIFDISHIQMFCLLLCCKWLHLIVKQLLGVCLHLTQLET